MLRRAVLFLCLFAWMNGDARAADDLWNGLETYPISLEQAIRMTLANNLDVRIEAISPKMEKDRVSFAWGAFDPVLNSSTNFESIERPQNAQEFVSTGGASREQEIIIQNQEFLILQLGDLLAVQRGDVKPEDLPQRTPPSSTTGEPEQFRDTPRIFEEDNVRSQTTLDGKIPLGTRYRFFLAGNRLENSLNRNSPPALFFPEYFTTTGVTLTQPLLKDFGTDANLAEVRIARQGEKIAMLAWKQQLINSLGTVMLSYYDMVFALENIKVKQDAIELFSTLKRENQRRLDVGLMSPIDVQQAGAAIARGQEELLTAKNLLVERQNSLKRQIFKEFDADSTRIFVPSTKPRTEAPPMDRSRFMSEAFANRPDYLQAIEGAEREEIRVRFARNQLWPRLDLQGTYALNGLAGSFGDSLSSAFNGQGPQWSAGVVFSVPLGNVQPRAQLRLAKHQKEQAILNIQRTELTVGIDVDTILSRIETNAQRVKSTMVTRVLAEEIVRIEAKRLEEGVSTSYEALQKQADLSEARTRELAAVTDLNKSLVQLQLATGTLLEKQGIIVDKANRKEPLQARMADPADSSDEKVPRVKPMYR